MKLIILSILLFSINSFATGLGCVTTASVKDRVNGKTYSAELIASFGKFYGGRIEVSSDEKTFCNHSYFKASTVTKTVSRRSFKCGKRARYTIVHKRTADFKECISTME